MVRNIATSRPATVVRQLRAFFPDSGTARGRASLRALGWAALPAIVVALAACATPPLPPANVDLPESLRVPSDEVLQDILTSTGDALYRCERGDTGLGWTYRGVQSTLVDSTGQDVGIALPGDYFSAYDGSYVLSRPDAQASVTADSLPWARLVARFNGADKVFETRFAQIGLILRVDTKGGLPPDRPCVVAGSTLNVPYAATYMIYRSPAAPTPVMPIPAAPASRAPERAVIPIGPDPLPADFIKLPRNTALPEGALPLPNH
ncbi:hypothetical protein C6P77_23880 [Burkholderia ambifaria]|nr:DUF3455 domain-containing protein [Burkholderia ambifaria]PRD96975.1 hypothetical protein C6P77_23880 [Burkholderia ambifaria]